MYIIFTRNIGITDFPDHKQGAGLKVEQGHELVSIGVAGFLGRVLAC